jgi:FKBP-type peptidyl-prolyl cis-trans isomerase (trigger factor)
VSDKSELKRLYDKALKEAIKVNDEKNKVIIDELKVKVKKLKANIRNNIRGEKRLDKRKVTISRVLVDMQLDGDINISQTLIADRCSVSLQRIRNTFCTIRKERNNAK